MGNSKGRRRRFGAVRQYRSGRWTASYLDPEGMERRAPQTFETKTDAEVWLSQVEADLSRGNWQDPDAGAVNFKLYASQWVRERGLSPTTEELYRRLLRLHILPTFGALDLDEITSPRVRTWRTERLTTTEAPTTVAKAYRLLKAIMQTATDDELIRRNPCRIRGAGKEVAPERPVATVEQVDALANAVGVRWKLMVYLGAYGPLRPEEQAELRRRDVDLDAMTLRITLASPELTTGSGPPGRRSQKRASGLSSCRTSCAPTCAGISTGSRRRVGTGCCLSARREPRSGAAPSAGSGGGPGPRSGCRKDFASTIFVTPDTPCRRRAGPRSRTRWSARASPPSGRR
jgi:hypothetical protein